MNIMMVSERKKLCEELAKQQAYTACYMLHGVFWIKR